MSTAPEIDLDEVEFPPAPTEQWVVLCQQLTADEVGVYAFLATHLEPHSGMFDIARSDIAERFDKSLDWVDKRMNALITAGALVKRATYWINPHNRSLGTVFEATDEYGVKRAQAPNTYAVPSREQEPLSEPAPAVRPEATTDLRFVYAVAAHDSNMVKIGQSKSVDRRLENLKNGSPVPLRTLWVGVGPASAEASLHTEFAHRRKHGEWFDFGDSDPVAQIREAALQLGVKEVQS